MFVWSVFIVLVLAAAATGGIFKPGDWYAALHKPSWTPPDWAFPVVWAALYAGIAWAGVLVWESEGQKGLALTLWGAQWAFNAAWSWLFFGRRHMGQAFFDVCLLWLSVAGFALAAWPLNPLASLLFLPYLAWVTVAASLNATVWRLNPEARRPA
ncbi:MAG: TspO/MBR family protein [Pseudomonadota bacterium]